MASRAQRSRGVAAIAVLAFTLTSGCAWRTETAPLEQPSPPPYEALRHEVALTLAQLETSVARTPHGNDATGATFEASALVLHQEAVGAPYVATPWAARWSDQHAKMTPLETAAAEAVATMLSASLLAEDAEVALMLGAGALARADAWGLPLPAGEEWAHGGRPVPEVSAESLATVAQARDRVVYLADYAAALGGRTDRAALGEVATDQHTWLAEATMIGSWENAPAYVVESRPQDSAERRALVAAALRDVATACLAQLNVAPINDRAWLLANAHDAHKAARALDEHAPLPEPWLGADVPRQNAASD